MAKERKWRVIKWRAGKSIRGGEPGRQVGPLRGHLKNYLKGGGSLFGGKGGK